MKTITFLLSLFLCTTTVLAQNQIPKKANTIVITGAESKQQFYDTLCTILFQSGYGILAGNKEQGIITTTEKSIRNGTVRLTIFIKDQQVLLRGEYIDNLSINMGGVTAGPSQIVIENKGMKGSPMQNAWLEFKKIADQIPGTKEYLIK